MATLGFGAVAGGAVGAGALTGPAGILQPAADDAAIYEYSYTTGTAGVYQLAGAWGAYFPFSFEFPDGALVPIRVTDNSANTEISAATFNRAANTLTVLKIFASTNSGAPVNWSGRTRLLVHALVKGPPVCPTPPTVGQVLAWDGIEWCPATPPSLALCPTQPLDGQVLVWSAAENAYCPADLCALVSACLAPPPAPAGPPGPFDLPGNIQVGDAASGTLVLSTIHPNELIVLVASNNNANRGFAGGVSSVSGAGLSWHRLTSGAWLTHLNEDCEIDIWWAFASGILSSVSITTTWNSSVYAGCVSAAGVPGVGSPVAPWDTNVNLPSTSRDTSGLLTQPTVQIATNNAADLLITVGGTSSNLSATPPASGWTLVMYTSLQRPGGTIQTGTFVKAVTATQALAPVNVSGTNIDWITFGAALAA